MAFVARAERKLILYSAASDLGPGSYMGHSTYKKHTSCVPFSSSAERTQEKPPPIYTPGPGSYLEVFSRPKPQPTSNHSPAFASQRSRFDIPQDSNPGPGSYNLTPRWSDKKPQQKSSNTSNWVRLPSAPSIPGTNQGYGYDETQEGELILHKGPQVILGTQKDSVGPGHYNPKYLTPTRGVLWHKSNAKRTGFQNKSSSPGPGAYAAADLKPKYKQKPSAVFVSGCKRSTDLWNEDESEDGVPGPGKYTVTSSFTPPLLKKANQNFGSGCERFKSATPEPETLGPGCYNMPNNAFSKKKVVESKAPFCSTNVRFQSNVDLNPGPGAYEEIEVKKKVWGKQGVFGSTEKRFYGNREEGLPGPGSYTIDRKVGSKSSNKVKGSSAFLSKSKRIDDKEVKSSQPAPGSYEIPSSIGNSRPPPLPLHPVLVREDQNSKVVGFSTQSERFFTVKSPAPGPGAYKVEEVKSEKGFGLGKDSRWKGEKAEIPGPGSYERQQNWNKKTFNVLFE